jgi:mannitol-1-phosphate/altronate dehydrogenase
MPDKTAEEHLNQTEALVVELRHDACNDEMPELSEQLTRVLESLAALRASISAMERPKRFGNAWVDRIASLEEQIAVLTTERDQARKALEETRDVICGAGLVEEFPVWVIDLIDDALVKVDVRAILSPAALREEPPRAD